MARLARPLHPVARIVGDERVPHGRLEDLGEDLQVLRHRGRRQAILHELCHEGPNLHLGDRRQALVPESGQEVVPEVGRMLRLRRRLQVHGRLELVGPLKERLLAEPRVDPLPADETTRTPWGLTLDLS